MKIACQLAIAACILLLASCGSRTLATLNEAFNQEDLAFNSPLELDTFIENRVQAEFGDDELSRATRKQIKKKIRQFKETDAYQQHYRDAQERFEAAAPQREQARLAAEQRRAAAEQRRAEEQRQKDEEIERLTRLNVTNPPSFEEWKRRAGYQGVPELLGRGGGDRGDISKFYLRVGRPTKQTFSGDHVYLYWKCSDVTVQLVLARYVFETQRFMFVESLNSY